MADEDFEIEIEPEERPQLYVLGEDDLEEFEFDDRAPNLVPEFSKHPDGIEALEKLRRMGMDTFDDDWEGSAPRREQIGKDWKIFTGDLPDKPYPFQNCANVHVPLCFENITRIAFRMVGELFGDWSNVFGVLPVGPGNDLESEILSKHGNWQLNENIPGFKNQMHRAVLMYVMHGDVTAASSWDPVTRCNRHEMLTPDEFVTPYVYNSTSPDYSDVPHYCRIRRYYKHELEKMRDVWSGVDEVIHGEAPTWESEPEQLLRAAAERVEGIEDNDSVAPFKIIQWEGYADLPGRDRQYFIQMFFDYSTGGILSLAVHEEDDWADTIRIEKQQKELSEYNQMEQKYKAAMGLQEKSLTGLLGNPDFGAEQRVQLQADNPNIPPPPRPKWLKEGQTAPREARRVPVRLFAHGVCVEPIAGNLGFGFGNMQANFNRAANTALDQYTDAATLNNGKGWIMDGGVTFEGGEMKMGVGVLNRTVGSVSGSIRDHIMPMEPGQPSPGLIEIVSLMKDYGQSAMQSPDVLSGEPGKSGETYRGIATRVEQATKQLSVATRKFADFFLQILRNNARLNSIYMEDDEMFLINQQKLNTETNMVESVWEMQEIGKKMYRRSYNITLRSDLKYGTDTQKVGDADALVQTAMAHPMLQANASFQYEALKKSLEARNMGDMIPLLGPPPPVPDQPMALPPPPPEPGQPQAPPA